MLTDLYIEELETFIEVVRNKGEEACLYMTYKELIAERDAIIEALRKYEKEFSMDSDESDFEESHPDPRVIYHINLERLALLSELIYHKDFSLTVHKNAQRLGESLPSMGTAERDKIIGMIKKNPKCSYIDILKQDIQLKTALDLLIEDSSIYRAGKTPNTYWRINIT